MAGVKAAELATKLGVDKTKLVDALKAFRDAHKPSTPPAQGTKPDRAAMEAELAKSLASSLGIDEAKVTAALDELKSEAQAKHAAALRTKLTRPSAAAPSPRPRRTPSPRPSRRVSSAAADADRNYTTPMRRD